MPDAKKIVIGDGIGSAGIKYLAKKGLEIIVVDKIEDTMVKLVATDYDPHPESILIEDRTVT